MNWKSSPVFNIEDDFGGVMMEFDAIWPMAPMAMAMAAPRAQAPMMTGNAINFMNAAANWPVAEYIV